MTIDSLRRFCLGLPHVTEDIKWGDDLVFSIAKKMFVVIWMQPPYRTSFKATPEEFAELIERDGVTPAAYMARNHWVTVEELSGVLDDGELKERIRRSFDLVKMKLPRKVQAEIDGAPAATPRRGPAGKVKRDPRRGTTRPRSRGTKL